MGSYLAAWRVLSRCQFAMILILAGAVALANTHQPYPEIAPLQHVPTVILVLATPPLLRRWPLSNGAVAGLLTFWLLHTLGGRYTYSNVPYDDWAHSLTGHTISTALGVSRNGYDRLVHLAFGFCGSVRSLRSCADIRAWAGEAVLGWRSCSWGR